MIPFLAYPLALIALATVPALAAIYILRNRYRRRDVSSLLLWKFNVQSKAGGAKVHRLQLPLLFFLELLILLLLVTAATGPHWKLPQSVRPLIVILDNSFSMRALHADESTRARAEIFLEKLFQRQPPPATRLILAGSEPRLLGAPVKTWAEVKELLRQWRCWSPDTALDSAITLASELGKQQANILILTDQRPIDEKISNPRLEWHAFGWPVENVAIVNASRTAFGDQDRCLLEVANLSATLHTTKILVQTGTNVPQSLLAALGAQDRQRFVFNIPSATPSISAVLEPDALAEDNEVRLLPPIRKHIRVQVALTNEAFSDLVNRTLEATGLRATLTENPELVIHETDAVVSSNSWSLRCLLPAESTAFTGPFIVDSSHPLAEGIALEGVIWAGAMMTNTPGEVPVILAGNTPLLSLRDDAFSRRHLTLNLNPQLSTLTSTPDWPILFWNLLKWRAVESPGLKESNARLGSEVILKTTGEPVTINLPDGTVNTFPKTADQISIETPLPGIYSVSMGQTTNSFAVNPLAADESDLSVSVTGQWGAWGTDSERRMEEASLVWIFGLAALGLLALHLYLLAAGKGGR
ncbi:MAG: VWA domain-containing protein [Verrucomicrobiales bacterium]|nr:VWA domain-containing protein [Verrucomicrobiales bacterium]